MNVVRYEPFGVFRRFHDELNRAFVNGGNAGGVKSGALARSWSPAVDVEEKEDRYVLKADIPGVEPKEIKITMERGVLTIKGERAQEIEDKAEGYKRVERINGSFTRSFTLPETIDGEGIEAAGKNGVLTVTIPKREQVKPRRIEVH